MTMSDENKVLDELNKAVETLHESVDKKIADFEDRGMPVPQDLTDKIEGIDKVVAELMGELKEVRKAANRPSTNLEGTKDTPEAEFRKKAYDKYLRYGAAENASMSSDELRALSNASDADGGFLVPIDWTNELLMNAYNLAALRPVMGATPTGRDTVMLPSISKPTVGWGTTNIAVNPQDLDSGGERITIYDLRALTLLHNNTLDDAEANIWAELTSAFDMAIAEAEDDAFAVGAGNNSPQGIIADDRVQANFTVTGVADAISDASNNGIDALIECYYALKTTYRRNSTWAMNSLTEGQYRQLKDADGQYLWQPPVQAGDPATLLGRPIVNPEGLPDVAAGTFPVVFGDMRRGYRIKDRAGITIQRLVERYAEYDQTGFLVKRRVGGQVVLAEAFRCIKVSA